MVSLSRADARKILGAAGFISSRRHVHEVFVHPSANTSFPLPMHVGDLSPNVVSSLLTTVGG